MSFNEDKKMRRKFKKKPQKNETVSRNFTRAGYWLLCMLAIAMEPASTFHGFFVFFLFSVFPYISKTINSTIIIVCALLVSSMGSIRSPVPEWAYL